MIDKKRWLIILAMVVVSFSFESKGMNMHVLDSAFQKIILDNFELLPEMHLEVDLYTYFLQKNPFFKEHYYVESDPRLSFALLSFRQVLYSIWDFDFEFQMGKTPNNVVFDPMGVNFGLVPAIEYRLSRLFLTTGIDHRCYHEIDRKEFPTVYNNKVFIGAASPNHRSSDYRNNLITREWEFKNRFSYNARWGYFIKEFFDLVDPGKVDGQNPRVHEFSCDMRYAFYKRRSWIQNVRYRAYVGQSERGVSPNWYWRNDFAFESNLRTGIKGGLLFVQYTIDDLPRYQGTPRFSKDRLLQVGIRFFN